MQKYYFMYRHKRRKFIQCHAKLIKLMVRKKNIHEIITNIKLFMIYALRYKIILL